MECQSLHELNITCFESTLVLKPTPRMQDKIISNRIKRRFNPSSISRWKGQLLTRKRSLKPTYSSYQNCHYERWLQPHFQTKIRFQLFLNPVDWHLWNVLLNWIQWSWDDRCIQWWDWLNWLNWLNWHCVNDATLRRWTWQPLIRISLKTGRKPRHKIIAQGWFKCLNCRLHAAV